MNKYIKPLLITFFVFWVIWIIFMLVPKSSIINNDVNFWTWAITHQDNTKILDNIEWDYKFQSKNELFNATFSINKIKMMWSDKMIITLEYTTINWKFTIDLTDPMIYSNRYNVLRPVCYSRFMTNKVMELSKWKEIKLSTLNIADNIWSIKIWDEFLYKMLQKEWYLISEDWKRIDETLMFCIDKDKLNSLKK